MSDTGVYSSLQHPVHQSWSVLTYFQMELHTLREMHTFFWGGAQCLEQRGNILTFLCDSGTEVEGTQ